MLPSVRENETDQSIMDILAVTDQINIFQSRGIQSVIEFKWNSYAFKFHIFFSMIHLFYFFTFVRYINAVYINNDIHYQF